MNEMIGEIHGHITSKKGGGGASTGNKSTGNSCVAHTPVKFAMDDGGTSLQEEVSHIWSMRGITLVYEETC